MVVNSWLKLATHGDSMTVRYYKRTDAGAPSNSATYCTGYQNILNQCLVTGYGSKVGAGWTRVDHVAGSGGYSVFKMNAGSGACFRMTFTETDSSWTACTIAGGSNWINSTVGLENQFPPRTRTSGLGALYTGGGGGVWEMIASETFMILVPTTVNVVEGSNLTFFGDIIPFKDSDNRACVIGGYNQSTTGGRDHFMWSLPLSMYWSSSRQNAPFGVYLMTDHQGMYRENIAGVLSDIHHFMNPNSATIGTWASYKSVGVVSGYRSYLSTNDPATGDDVISRVIVHCNGMPRGYLPGIWHIASSGKYTSGQVINGTGAHAGRQFKYWGTGSGTDTIGYLIEISDTWYV